jgi:hypothetical protein
LKYEGRSFDTVRIIRSMPEAPVEKERVTVTHVELHHAA